MPVPPSRSTSKKKALRIHSSTRCLQRYDFELTRVVRQEFIRQIQSGEARHLFTESLRLTHFEVKHESGPVYVVYDKQRKELVTLLPKENLNSFPKD